MSEDFLKNIIEHKRGLLKNKKAFFEPLKKKIKKEKFNKYGLFKNAIAKAGQMNLIAELKKSSPSAGVICPAYDLLKIARIYAENGAAALSILTEEKYFLGKPADIKRVSGNLHLPILTKDFIIDEVQIYEAFYNGASAVLLIVAILNDNELKTLLGIASELDLDALVEVHDEKELERALKAKAELIGVNNRNLDTLEVDLSTCHKLIPKIPKGKVIVAESGLKSHQDIAALEKLGAHAVLIGETFLRAEDIGKKMREVMYGYSG